MKNNLLSTNFTLYKTIIFDCDGVILNSNKIKSDSFYRAVINYGDNYAQQLLEHHINNGGISRYEKFNYFFSNILKRKPITNELEQILEKYALLTKNELINCQICSGLDNFRLLTHGKKWLVVSGGNQEELRSLFLQRNLNKYFDGSIFGSPDNKETILLREQNSGNIVMPALFIGDSRYDFEVAQKAKIDFAFVYKWSEMKNWEKFFSKKRVFLSADVKELSEFFSKKSIPTNFLQSF